MKQRKTEIKKKMKTQTKTLETARKAHGKQSNFKQKQEDNEKKYC